MPIASDSRDGGIAAMNTDVQDSIYGLMSATSMASYRCTSKANNRALQDYMKHRKTVMLAQFVTNVPNFDNMLRVTNSVLSGSLVVRLLFPRLNDMWNLKDMDLYTTVERSTEVVDFLVADQYKVADPSIVANDYNRTTVKSVVTLLKGTRKVNVIASTTASPLYPIFHFHSTAVMNYMSADILFSAYPAYTTAFSSIINASNLRNGKFNVKFCQALVKYSKRGFAVVACPAHEYVEDTVSPDKCHDPLECPQHIRNTHDEGCLRISFDSAVNAFEVENGIDESTIVWCIGGNCCTGTRGEIEPFVLIA
ncbi:hypothetical protein BV22DRAFT_1046452 [Leucogyrophana mollusca]|uniref:Uncharacterized protein n=1 Tax=Leucogyrophana mollusca TaxID=85980 RepID=A0ACB8BKI3_9AGAM|nr:hypothetical protein BV22DRAFT_1046452 [Leucogyrophana mollusca]